MATTMVEPFAPWLRDFNQILHNQAGSASAFIPPADLLVDDDGVTVYMDVPGLRAENLDIELENDVLTIRGERPFPYAREDGKGTGPPDRARLWPLRAGAAGPTGA